MVEKLNESERQAIQEELRKAVKAGTPTPMAVGLFEVLKTNQPKVKTEKTQVK